MENDTELVFSESNFTSYADIFGASTGNTPVVFSPAFHIPELCLLFFLLVGNSTVCWIIFTNENLRNRANMFVAILASADLCFGIFVAPFIVAGFLGDWYTDPYLCNFSGVITTLFPAAANVTLCFVSIDRLLFVRKPLRYQEYWKSPRCIVAICYVWIHALIFPTLPPLFGWGKYIHHPAVNTCIPDLTEVPLFGYVTVAYGFVLPSVIMIYCYYRIYRAARLQVMKVRSEAFAYQATTVRRVLHDTKLGYRRTAKTLILMIVLHTVCWTPNLYVQVYSLRYGDSYAPSSKLQYVSALLILTNTSLEPWVYGMYNVAFRKAVRRLFTVCDWKRLNCFRACPRRPSNYQVSPII
ncbi:adenosine receptor A2a-like [Saccoglossus kowalevskii]|uniref:Melanopsin-like n=1 Tax=Saccoglossus kowalevskii TaxID=10224 RepID=A0ABM0MFT9_SACKO|nr:PREDICTED: melanopsin-like [Saccoglossus kowalevskii]